jgi:hypothetical protein
MQRELEQEAGVDDGFRNQQGLLFETIDNESGLPLVLDHQGDYPFLSLAVFSIQSVFFTFLQHNFRHSDSSSFSKDEHREASKVIA